MDRIEYKEGMIEYGGQKASNQLKVLVACLSAYTGQEQKETCDLLNQLLQSFESLWDSVKDLIERLDEILTDVSKDICESCTHRRTRHGSSKAEKPLQAKANIKWQEKYRPP